MTTTWYATPKCPNDFYYVFLLNSLAFLFFYEKRLPNKTSKPFMGVKSILKAKRISREQVVTEVLPRNTEVPTSTKKRKSL